MSISNTFCQEWPGSAVGSRIQTGVLRSAGRGRRRRVINDHVLIRPISRVASERSSRTITNARSVIIIMIATRADTIMLS